MSTEGDPPGTERPFGVNEPLVTPREQVVPAEGETSSSADAAGGSLEPETEDVSARTASPSDEQPHRHAQSPNMLPARERRRSGLERLVVRLIATCGIVAIGVAIAAIMVSNHSHGWIVGLVVSIVTVVLAALLWSSRML